MVHGRHCKADEVRRKGVGEATLLHKDVAFYHHVRDHHSQYRRQAHDKDAAEQGQVSNQPAHPARPEMGHDLPDRPEGGEKDEEGGVS